MQIQCEFGCECDTIIEHKPFDLVLEQVDFERLIQEKAARAQRYINLMERVGGQFETD